MHSQPSASKGNLKSWTALRHMTLITWSERATMFGARSVRAAVQLRSACAAPRVRLARAIAGGGLLAYSLGTAWGDGEVRTPPTEQRLPLCSVYAWGNNRYVCH